jgi:hypothetical protein
MNGNHQMPMRKAIRRLALPLAAAALIAGCAPTFEARVTHFSSLPNPPAKSFYIEPANPAYVGGLEFATYANLVRKEMVANGFTELATPANADVTVQLDYHVGAPRERIQTRPGSMNAGWGWGGPGWGGAGWGWNPYWGGAGWGGAGWGWGGGWGGPGWGGGWGPEVYSVTEFTTVMAMKMFRTADKAGVFEGRAETTSRTNNLPNLMPNLVRAMFARFPGANGEAIRVRFNPRDPNSVPTISPAR